MLRYAIFFVLLAAIGAGIHTASMRGAEAIERLMGERVRDGLAVLGFDWARVRIDGLQIELRGNAPTVEEQAVALETSRGIARFARVVDHTSATLAPPERREPIRLEMMLDGTGLTLTGRLYGARMRSDLVAGLRERLSEHEIHDLTGVNAARPPADWGRELAVATEAAGLVPQAFIRVEPGRLLIEGVSAGIAERDALIERLTALAGPDLNLTIAIRVPAQVIMPFRYRAEKPRGGGALRVLDCAARTEGEGKTLDQIAQERGFETDGASCAVGLGGPEGDWPGAIGAGLEALSALPAGALDLRGRSVMLSAAAPTDEAAFEAVFAELAAALPAGFTIKGELGALRESLRLAREREAYWMRLERDAEGVSLAGRVARDSGKRTLETMAAARFGRGAVRSELVVAGGASPAGWQAAALATVDALAALDGAGGVAELTPQALALTGRIAAPEAARELHAALRAGLPEEIGLRTALTVDLPAAVDAIPLSPGRCAVALNNTVMRRQILFAPGSAEIDAESRADIEALAAILRRCPDARIEVGGHTDNQGREETNARLSRARAEAVLAALGEQDIARHRLVARGYGESEPIAPNDTEDGRALNRRIAFTALE